MLLLLGLLLVVAGVAAEEKTPQSISVLHFANNTTLFVADPLSGTVFAYLDTEGGTGIQDAAFNLPDIGNVVAALLGTSTDKVTMTDLAVHPATQEAYIAVQVIQGDVYVPSIVIFSQCGTARLFDLTSPRLYFTFTDTITEDFKFWGKTDGRALTFTDMELYDGTLYIAGLSTGPFQSTLRMIEFSPEEGFGANGTVAAVEMYHANHAQNETRAPIRTFTIVSLSDGMDYMIAAYTCTPLVIIPMLDLQDSQRVIGKTIADVGYGNTPIDLIDFMGMNEQMQPVPVVFLNNKDMSSQVIFQSEIERVNGEEGLSTFAMYQPVGAGFRSVPMAGLMHAAEQDEKRILGIRRVVASGLVELVSFQKNLYFRLDDFESEFEFPDYEYPEEMDMNMQFIKGVQDMLTVDSGIVKDEL